MSGGITYTSFDLLYIMKKLSYLEKTIEMRNKKFHKNLEITTEYYYNLNTNKWKGELKILQNAQK